MLPETGPQKNPVSRNTGENRSGTAPGRNRLRRSLRGGLEDGPREVLQLQFAAFVLRLIGEP
jgi:hypothetical protein